MASECSLQGGQAAPQDFPKGVGSVSRRGSQAPGAAPVVSLRKGKGEEGRQRGWKEEGKGGGETEGRNRGWEEGGRLRRRVDIP